MRLTLPVLFVCVCILSVASQAHAWTYEPEQNITAIRFERGDTISTVCSALRKKDNLPRDIGSAPGGAIGWCVHHALAKNELTDADARRIPIGAVLLFPHIAPESRRNEAGTLWDELTSLHAALLLRDHEERLAAVERENRSVRDALVRAQMDIQRLEGELAARTSEVRATTIVKVPDTYAAGDTGMEGDARPEALKARVLELAATVARQEAVLTEWRAGARIAIVVCALLSLISAFTALVALRRVRTLGKRLAVIDARLNAITTAAGPGTLGVT